MEFWFETGDHSMSSMMARTLIIMTYGIFVIRMSGRRVFANWTAPDIVVAIMFGSSCSRALTGNAPLLPTLAAMTLLLAFHWAVSHLAAQSDLLSDMLEGKPIDLLVDGKVDHALRLKRGISRTVIAEALHQAGIDHVEDAERMVLEPSGTIAVVKKKIAPSEYLEARR
ncbi:DUF421 domain-containing protein [Sphingomicrobium nitratireducens]|uniref:DUF421 domain-containing protein n=1 Tax=Sphingomicrobium nitratireducens TaxID=2964666 RepID=UPI00223F83AA|nr:YetF domain-containing protein [Sphingomicrobium nitratireducens]